MRFLRCRSLWLQNYVLQTMCHPTHVYTSYGDKLIIKAIAKLSCNGDNHLITPSIRILPNHDLPNVVAEGNMLKIMQRRSLVFYCGQRWNLKTSNARKV